MDMNDLDLSNHFISQSRFLVLSFFRRQKLTTHGRNNSCQLFRYRVDTFVLEFCFFFFLILSLCSVCFLDPNLQTMTKLSFTLNLQHLLYFIDLCLMFTFTYLKQQTCMYLKSCICGVTYLREKKILPVSTVLQPQLYQANISTDCQFCTSDWRHFLTLTEVAAFTIRNHIFTMKFLKLIANSGFIFSAVLSSGQLGTS